MENNKELFRKGKGGGKKKKKKGSWWKILLITLLVIVLIFGGAYALIMGAIAPQGGGELWGGSAYMAADQLAQNENFEEVTGLTEEDLVNLPAGCVVVWDQGNGHPHGHILVSLGDGREASDVIRPMTQGYGTTFRVFQPAR